MIDGSKKRKRQWAFELQNSCIFEKRSRDLGADFQVGGANANALA